MDHKPSLSADKPSLLVSISHGWLLDKLSYHIISSHVMSYHIMSRRVMSCHVVSCRVVSCRVVSCRVVSCRVMSCHVMSCHVMSCHVMSCHVMSCHVMSCHVMYHFVNLDEQVSHLSNCVNLSGENNTLHMAPSPRKGLHSLKHNY